MKILVLSERDDCCGPMAAAFLRDYSEKLEVVSAGRHPADKLPGLVVEAMWECLIDMEGYEPAAISSMDPEAFDVVYECPDLPCPETLDACRDLRDAIGFAPVRSPRRIAEKSNPRRSKSVFDPLLI